MKTRFFGRTFAVVGRWLAGAALAGGLATARLGAEGTAGGDYVLHPGDVVKVQVFLEPDLDREVRVSRDGQIGLPLIGQVDVKDRTVGALEAVVRDLYEREFLVNPQVNITVLKYEARTVNVLGSVNSPQAVEIPSEQSMTLLDAISRAGGFSRLADRRRVRLTRISSDGRTEN